MKSALITLSVLVFHCSSLHSQVPYLQMPDKNLENAYVGKKLTITQHRDESKAIKIWTTWNKKAMGSYEREGKYAIEKDEIFELENGNLVYLDNYLIEINTLGEVHKKIDCTQLNTFNELAIDPLGKYIIVMDEKSKETRLYTFDLKPKLLQTVKFTPNLDETKVGFFTEEGIQYAFFYNTDEKNFKSCLAKIEDNKLIKIKDFKPYVNSFHADHKLIVSYTYAYNESKEYKLKLLLYSVPSLELVKESNTDLYARQMNEGNFISHDGKYVYIFSSDPSCMKYSIENDQVVSFINLPSNIVYYESRSNLVLTYQPSDHIRIYDLDEAFHPYKVEEYSSEFARYFKPLFAQKTMRIAVPHGYWDRVYKNTDASNVFHFTNSRDHQMAILYEIGNQSFEPITEQAMKIKLDNHMERKPNSDYTRISSGILTIDGRSAGYYKFESHSNSSHPFQLNVYYYTVVDKNINYTFIISTDGGDPRFEEDILKYIKFIEPLDPNIYMPK